jgi:hypothetical protein
MTRAAQVVAVAFLVSLCVVSGNAAGSSEATEVGRTQLGVLGEPGRFAKLTGQRSAIQHSFIWDEDPSPAISPPDQPTTADSIDVRPD